MVAWPLPTALLLAQLGVSCVEERAPHDAGAEAAPEATEDVGVEDAAAVDGATARSFFFHVGGYDEDIRWWGAEDNDMVARAQAAGLRIVWVTGQTSMLHQWHPKRHSTIRDPMLRVRAALAWDRNHDLAFRRRGRIVRNGLFWGTLPDPDQPR